MPVVLHRIDNRLVHGQILESWVPRLDGEAILVVDEVLCRDEFHRMLIEGMGQGVLDIRVVCPDEAVSVLEGPLGDKRVIVLFQGVDEAVTARKAGMAFERLNLGNIHPREGCRDLTPSAHLSPSDERELLTMLAQGVLIEARAVPSDESPDVAAILAIPCGCCQTGAGRG